MYNVMLVLDDGEIRVIKSVKLVTWTRARVIFTDADDKSYFYMGGRIRKCEMEYIGKSLDPEVMECIREAFTNEETE